MSTHPLAQALYDQFVLHRGTALVRDGDLTLEATACGSTRELRSGRLVQSPFVLIEGDSRLGEWRSSYFEYTPRYWTKWDFIDIADRVVQIVSAARSRHITQMIERLGAESDDDD